MKTLKFLFTVCILCINTSIANAQNSQNTKLENTLLWKIEHPSMDKPSYLLGTLHMVCKSDYTMPQKIIMALNTVDQLILEADVTNTEELQIAQKSLMDAPKISEELTQEQFDTLDKKVQEMLGMPLQQFDQYGLLALQFMTYANLASCKNVVSVEAELMQLAKQKALSLNYFEKFSEQVEFIKKATPSQEAYRMILLTDDYKKDFGVAINDYLNERLEDCVAMINNKKYMDDNSIKYMLTIRNNNWMEKIPTLIENKSSLIAVGAAHLTNDNGLIHLLREKGYIVTPVL